MKILTIGSIAPQVIAGIFGVLAVTWVASRTESQGSRRNLEFDCFAGQGVMACINTTDRHRVLWKNLSQKETISLTLDDRVFYLAPYAGTGFLCTDSEGKIGMVGINSAMNKKTYELEIRYSKMHETIKFFKPLATVKYGSKQYAIDEKGTLLVTKPHIWSAVTFHVPNFNRISGVAIHVNPSAKEVRDEFTVTWIEGNAIKSWKYSY